MDYINSFLTPISDFIYIYILIALLITCGLYFTITTGFSQIRFFPQAIKSVLEKTPPELSADIIEKGIVLTGGGALLRNLSEFLQEELKVPVKKADDPLSCVAEGTGIMLEKLSYIDK